MSQHKTGYVTSYHGILCHDISYVITIAVSLISYYMHAQLQFIAPSGNWEVIIYELRIAKSISITLCHANVHVKAKVAANTYGSYT